jgi:hypothetical protein
MVLYQLNNSPLNIFIQWFLNTFFFLSCRRFAERHSDHGALVVGVLQRTESGRCVSWGRPFGSHHPSFVLRVLGLDQMAVALNRQKVSLEH